MAEKNLDGSDSVRKRTRDEEENGVLENEEPGAKRAYGGPDAGLMALLNRIDEMDRYNDEEEQEQNGVTKSQEEDAIVKDSSSSCSTGDFNFNGCFLEAAYDFDMNYFHFGDGGLMAVGLVPDYGEVTEFSQEGTLWEEDDIWQLKDRDANDVCSSSQREGS